MTDNTLQKRLKKTLGTMGTQKAIEWGNQVQSYHELDKTSDNVAKNLQRKGISEGTFIGIITENKIELITVMLGILKAGCVFIPLDPVYPNHRIKIMLTSTNTKWLFVDQPTAGRLAGFKEDQELALEMVLVDELVKESLEMEAELTPVEYKPEDKIYIYFTSGSSGQPKAIIGQNKSLLHFVNWEIETFQIDERTRVSQFTSPSHDPFLRDIFVPLCSGGTICIPDNRETILDTVKLVEWINRSKVTVIHCTPSLFKIFNHNQLKNNEDYQALKYVLLAGEKIHPKTLENWFEVFGERIGLINLYGPTETTLAKVYHPIKREDLQKPVIPIGKPISGTRVIIVNQNMEVCDTEDIGELYIRTPYRSLGYYQDSDRNRERFIMNPFNQDPNDVIYKTGDLGRLLPDGNIELIGRMDRQVKIRGFRVELDEIEQVLLSHEKVKAAAVVERESNLGELRIYAWIEVAERGSGAEELNHQKLTVMLRDYLKEQLPDYMIPQAFIPRETMPLTANGKINYKTLRENIDIYLNDTEYIPPRDEMETKLVQIWREILNIERVGIRNSFLELGGNSLNIMALVARIFKEYGVELSLDTIFNHITIESLAQYIETAEKGIYAGIEPAPVKEYYPVSSAQKRLYILDRFEGAGTSYNISGTFEVIGDLHRERFEKIIQQLIERHESFRTSFEFIEGQPVQRIHPEVNFDLYYQKLDSEAAESKETINGILQEFIRPFDLSHAPLLRVGLLKISDNRHLLMFDTHHIITDGTSMNILIRDFAMLYNGETLTDLRIQYKDFSEWQHELFQGQSIKQQEAYWLKLFDGELPVLNLPLDYPRPAIQSFAGETVYFALDQAITSQLNQLAIQNGVTLYMVLLAAYTILLAKYSSQEDIVVGSPIAGRPHADLENIIGMFVNTLTMRNYPAGNKTFLEFLCEVKTGALQAYENQDYPFEELVEKLDLKRDLSRNPLFDIMFAMQNIRMDAQAIGGLDFSPYPLKNEAAKFDLTIQAFEQNGELIFSLEYAVKLFKLGTIRRMIEHFRKLVEEVVSQPGLKISKLEMLTEAEKRQLIYEFNDTKAEYPREKTIQELFEEQAAKTPGNIALVFEGQQMTYGEINQKANQLARVLRKKGVQAESIVGIMVERSLEMIIGILGILKAGGAYLPIDPEYPEERIKFMLADSGAGIILTQSHLKEKYVLEQEIIDLENEAINDSAKTNLKVKSQPQDLAYVIYTSGSTGKPKGVMIEHSSIINILTALQNLYPLQETDTYLLKTTYTFDVSVTELFGWFFKGGKLVLLKPHAEKSPKDIIETINRYHVSHINFVPSMLNVFLEFLDESAIKLANDLKYVMVAGEALPVKLVKEFQQKFKGLSLENLYGPTELTIYATKYSLQDMEEENIIPIGKPLPNIKTYILDRNNNLAVTGIPGELCLSGAGLARGYLNRPELNDEKFVTNPFISGERMYRTGDLARWLPNGNIEFLGRMDQQVKIRGFRIELGEIENQLIGHELIKEAVVIDRIDTYGDQYLCAYLISEEQLGGTELGSLKQYLLEFLPEYMVPSFYIQIDKIPLMVNGKIDREALLKFEGIVNTGSEYIAPEGETEKKLVEIWKEVLGVKKIGVKDQFFTIGGNSLKLIQVHLKIDRLFPGKVTPADLFSYPNIEELARFIDQEELLEASPEIDPVRFPSEYFIDEDEENEDTIIEFTITQEQLTRMKNRAFKENVEVYDILIAAYLRTLGEVVTGQEITIQIMVDAYRIFPLKINVIDITELSNLIQIVHEKLGMVTIETTYSIDSIRKIGLNYEYDMVIPFFAKKEHMQQEIFKIGDIILGADEMLGVMFHCEYNPNCFRRDKVEELISRYAELILTIID